ncbi:MAG: SDR family NAD(P)-dependent oxidoreductase [Polyangiaceae bacterium]|nr:SDR family NAD(P)-dependent oxidoreductase [Polyangiaceae bacterium]
MASNHIDLDGRTVLITGGSRGLGLLLAEAFGLRGARIALCGRAPEAVDRAENRLRGMGIDVHAVACDLGEPPLARNFVESTFDRFGRIDVIVNNAGTIQVGPIESVTVERFHDAMDANFWSAVYVTLTALPTLKLSGSDARIVNVTSIGGRAGMPHMLPYDSSKYALMGFSEALRAELSSRPGMPRVVTVVPGLMRTGSFYNAEFAGNPMDEFGWFSVGSSLPFLTIDATTAAKRIVEATVDGRTFLRLGMSSYVLDFLHRLSPAMTVRLMGLVARMLPKGSQTLDTFSMKGRLVDSELPGSWLLKLGDKAATANNEMPPSAARA